MGIYSNSPVRVTVGGGRGRRRSARGRLGVAGAVKGWAAWAVAVGRWRWGGRLIFAYVDEAPFAGPAAQAGGVVGAQVEFDGVPQVADAGIHGRALEGDGFLGQVVGVFGRALGGFGGLQGGGGGGDFADGGPGHGGTAGEHALGFSGGQFGGPLEGVGGGVDVGHGGVLDGEFIIGPGAGRHGAAVDGEVQDLDEVAEDAQGGGEAGGAVGGLGGLGGEGGGGGGAGVAPRGEDGD